MDGKFWCARNVSDSSNEAVVAKDKTAINWLQLRFGGNISDMKFDVNSLKNDAMSLPPAAVSKDISCVSKHRMIKSENPYFLKNNEKRGPIR